MSDDVVGEGRRLALEAGASGGMSLSESFGS